MINRIYRLISQPCTSYFTLKNIRLIEPSFQCHNQQRDFFFSFFPLPFYPFLVIARTSVFHNEICIRDSGKKWRMEAETKKKKKKPDISLAGVNIIDEISARKIWRYLYIWRGKIALLCSPSGEANSSWIYELRDTVLSQIKYDSSWWWRERTEGKNDGKSKARKIRERTEGSRGRKKIGKIEKVDLIVWCIDNDTTNR